MGNNMYRFKENKLFFQSNTSLFQALKYWGKTRKKKGTRKFGKAGKRKKEGEPVIISFTTPDWSA